MKRTSGWVYGAYGAVIVAILGCSYTCSQRVGVRTDGTDAPAASDENLDPAVSAALRAIAAAWHTFRTVSADIDMDLSNAAGLPGYTKGKGQYDLDKTEGTTRIRFRNRTVVMAEEGTVEGKYYGATESLYWVTDGEILYRSSEHIEYHRVTKSRYHPDDVLQLGGPAVLDALRRDYDLRLRPDEEFDGEAVFVIEATPRDGDGITLNCFDKSHGLRRQWIEQDDQGETTFKLTVTKPQFDVTFEADHFTFEIPEDAEVVDETATDP